MKSIDPQTMQELEAAAFRRLLSHLRKRTDVQNIAMMELTGFCRNCLSNWVADAARDKGFEMGKDEAREIVYGEPYTEWQAKYQTGATPSQQAAFDAKQRAKGE